MNTAIAVEDTDTDHNLIKPTPREELMAKIADMQNNNLTEAQIDRAQSYCKIFTDQCRAVYGLSKQQLREFTNEQLIELGEILFERDRKTVKHHNVLFICIPFFGWCAKLMIWSDGGTYTERRVDLYKKLKIHENNNLFR